MEENVFPLRNLRDGRRTMISFSRSGYGAVLLEVFKKLSSWKKANLIGVRMQRLKGLRFVELLRMPSSFLSVGRATCKHSLPDFSPLSCKQKAANRLNPVQRPISLQTETVKKQRANQAKHPSQSIKTFSGHNSLRRAK